MVIILASGRLNLSRHLGIVFLPILVNDGEVSL